MALQFPARIFTVITVYRESETRKILQANAKGKLANSDLLESFMQNHRLACNPCTCNPHHVSILLLSFSSNENVSVHRKSQPIRDAIQQCIHWGTTAIVTRNEDGLSTNVDGIASLLRPYQKHDVIFSVHLQERKQFEEYEGSVLVAAIEGTLTGKRLAGPEYDLVARMMQVGSNKAALAQLHQANKVILGGRRNALRPRSDANARPSEREECAICHARFSKGHAAEHARRHARVAAIEAQQESSGVTGIVKRKISVMDRAKAMIKKVKAEDAE